MTAREAWQKAAEVQLREWQTKLDDLRGRFREGASCLAAGVRSEREKQIEALERRIAEARARLAGLREAKHDAFEDVRKGIESGWGEIRHGFESAARRFEA